VWRTWSFAWVTRRIVCKYVETADILVQRRIPIVIVVRVICATSVPCTRTAEVCGL
jgi:hypothetical protein